MDLPPNDDQLPARVLDEAFVLLGPDSDDEEATRP